MSDLEILRRLAADAAPSEEEIERAREGRDYAEDSSGHLEARRPSHSVPNLTDDEVRALVSDEAQLAVIQFEVTSKEAYHRKYERPIAPGGDSGITVGIGYDVGYNTPEAVRRDFSGLIPDRDIEALTKACGLKGDKARARLSEFRHIVVPWEAAFEVYRRATVPRFGRLVLGAFPNAAELKGHCFGAMLSLVYNRGPGLEGDRRREMRAIRDLMAERRWSGVPEQFRAMKRLWEGQPALKGVVLRREAEALLFERGLEQMTERIAVAAHRESTLESARNDLEAIEGDGFYYQELDDAEVLERTDPAWNQVVWPPRAQAPDYSHVPNRDLAGSVFQFGPRELEFLIDANGFQPSRQHGRIVFALRGAQLVQAPDRPTPMERQEDREALTLLEGEPDHRTFRCVIGVYDAERGRMYGYRSSTVPNPRAVASYVAGGSPSNMMLTGCYQFEVGWHQWSKPESRIPGCLIENGRRKAVLRTRNNHTYELTDVVDDTLPGDNVHPGKSEGSAFPFSSWGCLVLSGSVSPVKGGNREQVEHTGEWARFRKALGLPDRGTDAHRREYSVVLLTGLDAAIAADALRRRLDPAGDVVRGQLYRLRQGSQGWRVAHLRRGLGMPAGERFDSAVAAALAKKQRAVTGGKADAIYSPASDAAFGFAVFSTPGPMAHLEGRRAAGAAQPDYERARDQLALDLGRQYEIARSPDTGDDANLESLRTIAEFGAKTLITTGNVLLRQAELSLRRYACHIDRDGSRKRIDDAAKTGLDYLKDVLVKVLQLTPFSFLSEPTLKSMVGFVVDQIILPDGAPRDAVVQRLDDGIVTLCKRWDDRILRVYGGDDRPPELELPKPAVMPAPAAEGEPPAEGAASKLLAALAAAASAENPNVPGARALIQNLRDHVRRDRAALTAEEHERFMDILCDARFSEKIYGERSADAYRQMEQVEQLVKEIEGKLQAGPQEAEAATRLLGALNELLANASVFISPETITRLLKALRRAKRFEDLSRTADRFATRDPQQLGLVSNWYAQGLIDSGRLVAAIEVLRAATERGGQTEKDAVDADGILGRAHKQIYVNFVRSPQEALDLSGTLSEQLRLAMQSYGKRYDPTRAVQTYYHGINYIALLKRAERDRVRLDSDQDANKLALGMIEQLKPAAPGTTDPWLLASLGEAYLATGNIEEAARYFGQYANHPHIDAFALNGTVRQLEEVWQLSAAVKDAGAILTGLKAALATKENGFVSLSRPERLQLADSSDTDYQHFFETKVDGGKYQKLYDLQQIIRRGAAVAAVQEIMGGTASTIGTGFLVKGADLDHRLPAGKSYVLTNAHVLWDAERGQGAENKALRPDEAQIVFETALYDGQSAPYKCARIHWQSPSSLHDATLFELDRPVPADIKPLELASRSTPLEVTGERRKGTRLAVIGHPEGGSLSISVLGSLDEAQATLVDMGPRGNSSSPIYLHYRTPTEGGNSGSPVFEIDRWRVVALHHAGYNQASGLAKLGGKPGSNFANEGIWIESIREAMQEDLKEAKLEKKERRRRWFR
jgi:V8-like Glu-specific endopeptidase